MVDISTFDWMYLLGKADGMIEQKKLDEKPDVCIVDMSCVGAVNYSLWRYSPKDKKREGHYELYYSNGDRKHNLIQVWDCYNRLHIVSLFNYAIGMFEAERKNKKKT